jgi:hypothetical protein
VFENRVLRKIFGPKRDEVTWEWRRLLNEELNDRYCSLNTVRVNNEEKEGRGMYLVWGRGGERCIQGSGGNTCEKEGTLRPRHRWEDNIKIDFQDVRWGCHGLDSCSSG